LSKKSFLSKVFTSSKVAESEHFFAPIYPPTQGLRKPILPLSAAELAPQSLIDKLMERHTSDGQINMVIVACNFAG
jgi:hypothetical protein